MIFINGDVYREQMETNNVWQWKGFDTARDSPGWVWQTTPAFVSRGLFTGPKAENHLQKSSPAIPDAWQPGGDESEDDSSRWKIQLVRERSHC